jgi:hypothetical protein
MNTEDIIREILSKMCPLHGKHANVEIKKDWQLNISACCREFHEQMENIIKDFQKKGEDTLTVASFQKETF